MLYVENVFFPSETSFLAKKRLHNLKVSFFWQTDFYVGDLKKKGTFIHPFILFHLCNSGSQRVGAYPSYHRAKSGVHLMSNVWIMPKWKSHIVTPLHSIPPNLTCICQEMWQHTESTESATTWMACKVAVRSFQIPVKVRVPTERLDLQTDLIHVCLWTVGGVPRENTQTVHIKGTASHWILTYDLLGAMNE